MVIGRARAELHAEVSRSLAKQLAVCEVVVRQRLEEAPRGQSNSVFPPTVARPHRSGG